MMMFDDKVGGWGWLNDDVIKKYARKTVYSFKDITDQFNSSDGFFFSGKMNQNYHAAGSFFKLKQSLLLKLLGICHIFVFVLTFENSNQIKLLQIASNCIRLIIWLKQDKIGSNWIKLDRIDQT